MSTTAKTGTEWLRNQAKKVTEGADLVVTAEVAASVGVEAWLQRHHVAYSPPGPIPMALIDEKRSRANQARRDPIVPDSVERFAAAIRAGATLPPIVVYPLGGRLIIIDGNNRQAATRKAGIDQIEGIVVAEDTPSELVQLLTVDANACHGVTPELSWRIQQAFHLCSLGFTDPASAEAAGISLGQLRGARLVQEADQRARALKIGGFSDLSVSARQQLGVLRDEAVFYLAGKVAADTAMTTEEIRDLTRAVKKLPSEGARVEYVGTVAKERGIERATRKAMGRASNRVSSAKMSLVAGIGKILAVDEAVLIRQVVTTHDRDQINHRLQLLDRKLRVLEVAMGTLRDLGEE